MHVLRASLYRRMPWKNGGGETIEMIVSPAAASFDDFDWRISMAHVGTSGPFSAFPGIDRTLTVIAGDGIRLEASGQTLASIHGDAPPFSFSGDLAVDGILIGGPIDDLNVMTRRSRFRHRVAQHFVSSRTELRWQGDAGIVVTIAGDLDIEAQGDRRALAPKDAIVFEANDARDLRVSPRGDARLLLIELQAAKLL